jgi:hypothetical protein
MLAVQSHYLGKCKDVMFLVFLTTLVASSNVYGSVTLQGTAVSALKYTLASAKAVTPTVVVTSTMELKSSEGLSTTIYVQARPHGSTVSVADSDHRIPDALLGTAAAFVAWDIKKTTFTGKVKSESLEGDQLVEGAKVILVGADCDCDKCDPPGRCGCCPGRLEATTDKHGRFTFEVVPGTYRLETEFGKYTKAEPVIKVGEKSTERVDVMLKTLTTGTKL